jgi:hypothetical protein
MRPELSLNLLEIVDVSVLMDETDWAGEGHTGLRPPLGCGKIYAVFISMSSKNVKKMKNCKSR